MIASTIAQRFGDLDAAERLSKLDLFADCTRAQLQKIDGLTTDLSIPKDSVLIREGSVAREFIVIRTGSPRSRDSWTTGSRTWPTWGPETSWGDGAAHRVGQDRDATAATDLEVLVCSVGEFRSILEIAPSVAHKVRRASLARAASLDIAA